MKLLYLVIHLVGIVRRGSEPKIERAKTFTYPGGPKIRNDFLLIQWLPIRFCSQGVEKTSCRFS